MFILRGAGYTQNGGAKGPVNLYISQSSDRGATWSITLLDISCAPPDCSAYECGWAFLGAQITMTSDASCTLYALWNAGRTTTGRWSTSVAPYPSCEPL